ncbi:MAG: hypothetical protein EBZ59_12385 [Planctomycetia bacterium]|nr:hypothetical protein [Planctomycetia bacterium]
MGPARAVPSDLYPFYYPDIAAYSGFGQLNGFAGGTIGRTGDLLTESFCDGMRVKVLNPAVAPFVSGTSTELRLQEFTAIAPLHQPKNAGGGGGFAPILFADGHVEKVHDTVTAASGVSNGDGYIGSSAEVWDTEHNGPTALTSDPGFVVYLMTNAKAFNEVSDQIWARRLRSRQSPAGSLNE